MAKVLCFSVQLPKIASSLEDHGPNICLLESWCADATTGRYGPRIHQAVPGTQYRRDIPTESYACIAGCSHHAFRTQREYIYGQLPRSLSTERGIALFIL
jgi:hypothetical protein